LAKIAKHRLSIAVFLGPWSWVGRHGVEWKCCKTGLPCIFWGSIYRFIILSKIASTSKTTLLQEVTEWMSTWYLMKIFAGQRWKHYSQCKEKGRSRRETQKETAQL
jgi:hypothetical protein